MATAVVLPKVGMTMEEGTLVRWLVPDGAAVTSGQPLFEMETEKVEMEVEADGEGVLRQVVREDTTLQPGDIVGFLLDAGEEIPQELWQRTAKELHERAPVYVYVDDAAATLIEEHSNETAAILATDYCPRGRAADGSWYGRLGTHACP